MTARKAPNCTSRPTAIARRSACQCELTLCRPVCRVFEPQPSPVPPSTATTPASDCVTCSRDESSRDIATFGVSSCLDMPILDRDMRAGCGTKAHAEATRDASTRNSAPDNNVAKRERRSGRAELAWDPRARKRASMRRACGRSGDGDRRAGVRRCALDIAKVSKGVVGPCRYRETSGDAKERHAGDLPHHLPNRSIQLENSNGSKGKK